jgi:hypothetical protein
MVSNALANHVGKEIVAMNFLTDVLRQRFQQRIILNAVITKCVRKLRAASIALFYVEVDDVCFRYLPAGLYSFFKFQQNICKVSISATSVAYIRNVNAFPLCSL